MSTHVRTLLFAAIWLLAATASAQPTATLESDASQDVRMEVGQTRLMHLSAKAIRVSVADPAVADVQVVTPQQVLITAKSVGYTHLIVWSTSEKPLVMAVSATRNLDQLRAQFEELFPGEKISVSAVGDLIVLSGTVSDLRLPARAAEVASLHSERLANLIQVTGDQQVQLDVRFAEVSRTGLRRAGVNFLWRDTQRGHIGGYSSRGVPAGAYLRGESTIPGTGVAPGPPVVPGPAQGDAFNFFFSTGLTDFPFSAILSILSQEGLAKVLAEPSLVALSGQEAEFHAGGELPILVAQDLGRVSVRFKKFGVQLKFTPTVLSDRTMSLKLGVAVSEPDPAAGVTVAGFQVPGFKTRSSDTTVRLRDGQSFAIAGLLSDDVGTQIAQVPGLGDLPIIGALFRSTAYRREETELLMVITAHLVQPLQPDEVPLMPVQDEFNDPNDFELFLFGRIEPEKVDDYEARERERRRARMSQNSRGAATTGAVAPAAAPARTPPTEAPAAPADPFPETPSESSAPEEAPAGDDAAGFHRMEGPLGPIGFIRG